MIILEYLLLPNSITNTNSSNYNPSDNLTCIGSVLSAPMDPGIHSVPMELHSILVHGVIS